MKKAIIFFSIFSLICTGCAHKYEVRKKHFELTSSRLNKMAFDRSVKVILIDGQMRNGKSVSVKHDSTSWMDEKRLITSPTSEISEIVFLDRRKGAMKGLKFGVIIGALPGFLIGYSLGDDNEGRVRMSQGGNAILGALSFGMLGGTLGLPVGYAFGNMERFIFTDNLNSARSY